MVLPYVGTLNGTVTSAFNGAPVAGASIVCGTKNTTTNASGQYTIYNVSIGDYNVQASATGYISESKPATITNMQTTTVDFALDPIPAFLQVL